MARILHVPDTRFHFPHLNIMPIGEKQIKLAFKKKKKIIRIEMEGRPGPLVDLNQPKIK